MTTASEGTTPEDPVCQVCGTPVLADDDNSCYCSMCLVPHHRDCWNYANGCSTYGCSGKQYVEGLLVSDSIGAMPPLVIDEATIALAEREVELSRRIAMETQVAAYPNLLIRFLRQGLSQIDTVNKRLPRWQRRKVQVLFPLIFGIVWILLATATLPVWALIVVVQIVLRSAITGLNESRRLDGTSMTPSRGARTPNEDQSTDSQR